MRSTSNSKFEEVLSPARNAARNRFETLPDGTSKAFLDDLELVQSINDGDWQDGNLTWAGALEEEFLQVVTKEDEEELKSAIVNAVGLLLAWWADLEERG